MTCFCSQTTARCQFNEFSILADKNSHQSPTRINGPIIQGVSTRMLKKKNAKETQLSEADRMWPGDVVLARRNVGRDK